MAEIAKAALVSVYLDSGHTMCTVFDGDDPCLEAEELRESVMGDYPDHVLWRVVANKAAVEIRGERVMKSLFPSCSRNEATGEAGR